LQSNRHGTTETAVKDDETVTLLLVIFGMVYIPLVAWLYGRQRRWHGAIGWPLLVGGLLLAFGGAGDLFPWAGLLWAFVAAFGLLQVLIDLVAHRWRRRGD
jgi:hypothetical protein